MSIINPADALTLLQRHGALSPEGAQELRGAEPSIIEKAMEAVESSPVFLEALGDLIGQAAARNATLAEQTRLLRADPRYANAPEVTATFVKQAWGYKDLLQEAGRETHTLPLPFLVNNRERLRTVTDRGENDWIAFELEWTNRHDGPFDVDEVESSLNAWLEATA